MDGDLTNSISPGAMATDLDPSRAAALDAWRARNSSAVTDEGPLRVAAACAALVDTDDGPRFGDSFRFVAKLPF